MGGEVGSARILAGFFGTLVAGVLVWVAILLLLWGVSPAILTTPDKIPETALNLYAIGLYLWLMALVLFFWRKVVRRSWTELGLRPSGRSFLTGILIGGACMALIMGLECAIGWARFAPPASWSPWVIVGSMVAALGFALSEEVLFRGFLLRTLAIDLPPRRAILLSALIFAALHFLKTNLSWNDLWIFAMLFGAGLVLAQVTMKTGSLWFAVGMHASWVSFFTASQQLKLWHWAETGLPLSGGATIAYFAIPLFVPLAYWIHRHHV